MFRNCMLSKFRKLIECLSLRKIAFIFYEPAARKAASVKHKKTMSILSWINSLTRIL